MKLERSMENVLDNVYSYSFSSQLTNQSGGNTIPVSGSFTVDYSNMQLYDINVVANGRSFTNGIIFRESNGNYGDRYNVNLTANQPSNDAYYLNFIYNTPIDNTFTNVRYVNIFTDYSTIPPISTFTQAQSAAVAANPVAVCFVTGARIRTSRGEVAVEDLRVGDRAVTSSGALRPVIWIGHRHIDGAGTVVRHDQQPIRIRQGAFGSGLPVRDLCLSPGHPVLVGADADGEGGHLVPIMCLINGTSIARETVSSVTYWHLELDSHDILLAEGLAAESYYDMGSRGWFAGENGPLVDPDFMLAGENGRCQPVALDGPVVEAERVRLAGVFATSLDTACAWDEAERFAWIAA